MSKTNAAFAAFCIFAVLAAIFGGVAMSNIPCAVGDYRVIMAGGGTSGGGIKAFRLSETRWMVVDARASLEIRYDTGDAVPKVGAK